MDQPLKVRFDPGGCKTVHQTMLGYYRQADCGLHGTLTSPIF